MPDVSKHKTNAERLAKHREGVATTLKRLELKVNDLTAAITALAERQCERTNKERNTCKLT